MHNCKNSQQKIWHWVFIAIRVGEFKNTFLNRFNICHHDCSELTSIYGVDARKVCLLPLEIVINQQLDLIGSL